MSICNFKNFSVVTVAYLGGSDRATVPIPLGQGMPGCTASHPCWWLKLVPENDVLFVFYKQDIVFSDENFKKFLWRGTVPPHGGEDTLPRPTRVLPPYQREGGKWAPTTLFLEIKHWWHDITNERIMYMAMPAAKVMKPPILLQHSLRIDQIL